MKILSGKKSLVTSLATEIVNLTFTQAQGLMKDLVGESGYQATAKDLFDLVHGGRNGLYEKILFRIDGESPINYFAVTKTTGLYSLSMSKENGVQYHSSSVTKLINLIEDYQQQPHSVAIEGMKANNAEKLNACIKKATTARGKNATVKDVLCHFQPNLRLGDGRYKIELPHYTVTFSAFLTKMIVIVEDRNNFKINVVKATELLEIIK